MLKLKDTGWLHGFKKKSSICCPHFWAKNIHRLKVRGWKKIFHAQISENKAGVAMLASDKIDFKVKIVIRDKDITWW